MENSVMTLIEAAQAIASDFSSEHEAEVALAHAIEHGDLRANVKRWATEQWEGRQLPGNINRLETYIQPAELHVWLNAKMSR